MTNQLQSDDRIPVIVGVGEITDRPADLKSGLEPLALLEQALKRAEQDSGGQLLGEIQSLDVVNFLSWRYRDPEIQLSERLGIKPKHPITARSAARARSVIFTKRRSGSHAANAAWPPSAAPKRSLPPPRPNAPASNCRGRRSRPM